MAISVAVPKELSGIKNKIVFNLTKRQLVCFGSGGFLGGCLYMATNDVVGTELSTFAMMIVLFPFLFLAMYEKEGFPAEKWLYLMLRQKFFTQGIRPIGANLSNKIKKISKKLNKIPYFTSILKN